MIFMESVGESAGQTICTNKDINPNKGFSIAKKTV
jgi:hypothetical protein